MSQQHDTGYKLLFSHPELVRDLLVEFVPLLQAETLNFASLTRVNGSYSGETGRARYSDMVWEARLADETLYICLVMEFQSDSDPWMALRMQVYIGMLYQDLVRQKRLSAEGKLPPVLPIVLYNGASRWRGATELAGLVMAAPAFAQHLQPAGRFLLIDEGAFDPEVLDTKTNLVAALFRLENSRSAEDVRQIVRKLGAWLADSRYASLRRDFALFIGRLLRRKVKDTTIPELDDLVEVQRMLAERRLDWWEEWLQQGLEQGLEKGRAEGRLEGEARLLRRQLERLFGDLPEELLQKLAAASEEDLLRWSEAVLEARTLQQIFSL